MSELAVVDKGKGTLTIVPDEVIASYLESFGNKLLKGCIEWLAFRRWQIIYAASLLAVVILAVDNHRLRGHVHQLSTEQVKTGLLLTRAEIKLNHMAKLVSDLRNGRVN